MKTRKQISKQETNKQTNKQTKKQIHKQMRRPENTKRETTNEQGNQKPTCEMNKLKTQLANVLICFLVLFFRVIPACAFSSMF